MHASDFERRPDEGIVRVSSQAAKNLLQLGVSGAYLLVVAVCSLIVFRYFLVFAMVRKPLW
jgi:hypothetical protein